MQWPAVKAVEVRNFTRLQHGLGVDVRRTCNCLGKCWPQQRDTSGLQATGQQSAVKQAEVRGCLPHRLLLQMSSPVQWKGTQPKQAQTWQPTAPGTPAGCSCDALNVCSSVTAYGGSSVLCWAPQLLLLLMSHRVYTTSHVPYCTMARGNQPPPRVLFKASVLSFRPRDEWQRQR